MAMKMDAFDEDFHKQTTYALSGTNVCQMSE